MIIETSVLKAISILEITWICGEVKLFVFFHLQLHFIEFKYDSVL